MSTWTDERIADLRAWAPEFSASDIAHKFGDTTRNAVIGKCARLGISLKKSWVRNRERGPNWSPDRAARRKEQRAAKRILRTTEPAPRYVPPPPPPNAPEPRNLGILDLARDECRWPVTDDHPFTFCGHAVVGERPYCAFHCSVAYGRDRPSGVHMTRGRNGSECAPGGFDHSTVPVRKARGDGRGSGEQLPK